jgi:hypothetical protein
MDNIGFGMEVADYLILNDSKRSLTVKIKLPTNSSIIEFFIIIFLALTSLFYLNGCALTPKAIELANEKAAPQYEYRNIKKLVSAVKQDNGDVSLCVGLTSAGEFEEPDLNTITIPLAILNREANQHERHGFYPGECPLLCYWYPIEKVKNGCDKITPEKLSAKSILPIEKITIHSQDQFYDLLNSYNENSKTQDKILEFSYASTDISIIYLFVQTDRQRTLPNGIAGVYEDKSTKLYYLTVPPAIVGDAIIVVVAMAVVIAGIALGVYLQLL